MSVSRRDLLIGKGLPRALAEFVVEAQDREILKVGIVPYFVKGGVRHYLVASPKPNRPEDKDKFLPFTLARGTRKGWIEQDGDVFFEDLDPGKWKQGDPDKDFTVLHDKLEPLDQAALREGLEELAVHYPPLDKEIVRSEEHRAHYAMKSFFPCGTIGYNGYPIQFFAGELAQEPPASYRTKASAEVRLVTLKEAQRMSEHGEFKPEYFKRLAALDGFIESQKKSRIR